MYDKKGFTLVEIMVVAMLFIIFIAAFAMFRSDSSKSENKNTVDQEYHNLYSRLENRLTRDLRSAIDCTQVSPGKYKLKVWRVIKDMDLVEQVVTYDADETKKIVIRSEAGNVDRFDFSKLLRGQKFIFKLDL